MSIDEEGWPLPDNGSLEEAELILRLVADDSVNRSYLIALTTTYFSLIKKRRDKWRKS